MKTRILQIFATEPDSSCQYKVFSKYFDISADRNDEVEACQTEQCRKTHYDDFIKAKEVADLILSPSSHNHDQYYTSLFALQSNEVNSKVNEIAMARMQARTEAKEQCGADDACTQRFSEEYFQRWANQKENKQLIAFVAGMALGVKAGINPGKGNTSASDLNKTLKRSDFPVIGFKVSQKQNRHIEGRAEYRGGGTVSSLEDAQKVLNAYHSGTAEILGRTSQGFPVVKYNGISGTNINVGVGISGQSTNVFIIKGTVSPSIVPTNPNWKP